MLAVLVEVGEEVPIRGGLVEFQMVRESGLWICIPSLL